jgi:hypothetical protein
MERIEPGKPNFDEMLHREEQEAWTIMKAQEADSKRMLGREAALLEGLGLTLDDLKLG